MSKLLVFISYSSANKHLAGNIKKCFQTYSGFEVFVAHDDIMPATNWEINILKNLRKTDLFIPLLTDNYRNSEFTDQELGMALALGKIIIPLKFSTLNPYGFFRTTQALKCTEENKGLVNAVTATIFLLTNNPDYKLLDTPTKDAVISALSKSTSYKTTSTILGMLTKLSGFTRNQLTAITHCFENNIKVSKEPHMAPKFKKLLLTKYGINVD